MEPKNPGELETFSCSFRVIRSETLIWAILGQSNWATVGITTCQLLCHMRDGEDLYCSFPSSSPQNKSNSQNIHTKKNNLKCFPYSLLNLYSTNPIISHLLLSCYCYAFSENIVQYSDICTHLLLQGSVVA